MKEKMMMKTTKMLHLMTILAIVVTMVAACGPSATEAPTKAPPTEAPAAPTAAPTKAPSAEHDLGGREINIGVENAYPPFNYIDEATNEAMGWDYDACRAICEVLNCTPVFVEAAWEGIFEATAAGEYDMVADGVTITSERDEVVDFSIPYMVIAQFIVVRADETEITDEASLVASGAPVGTQIGTTNEAKAIELVGEDRVQSFDTFDMPIQALIAGDVDAVIMDEEAAKGFAEQNAGDIKLLDEAVTGAEELGFVFPPGSDLTAAINYALGVLKDDGTLAELYDKYWGEEAAAEGYDLGGLEVAIGVENAYPPFNYIDEATNEAMGWDYDACRAICEVLNCTPVFVEAAWEGIFEATAAGEYDMVADGVTITSERDEVVDFSIPYMVIAQFIVVRADETEITDEASLVASGAPVGTQIGTTNEAKAIELVGEDRVQSFDTFDMPIQALIAGDVDAVIMDEEAAKGFAEQNAGDIKLLDEAVTGAEELGFVFPPGSDLTAAINYALGVLKDDGTLAELYDKYWGEE
jgi:polar amino acid transport system substrate-binding protein